MKKYIIFSFSGCSWYLWLQLIILMKYIMLKIKTQNLFVNMISSSFITLFEISLWQFFNYVYVIK